jgi:phage/plasmid-like protein (TIGR03299 family)
MTHAVENMAYANQVPWHGLGFKVAANLTAEAMRRAAKQDYTVSKRQVFFTDTQKKLIEIKNKFALVRDSDEKVLSMVGSVYRPVQTSQVFAFFHDFVKEAKMTMETAGSLWGGKYVWALARVTGNDFAIGKKDEMRNYLLLLAPFEHGKALIMQYTSVRVVCWNTLCMALGANLKGKGHSFRMAHTKDFEVEKEEAKRVLGLITDQAKEFKEASTHLAAKKITKDATEKFFLAVAKSDADALRVRAIIPKFKAALEHAPGAMLTSAKGTWWGAVNAVTYVVDHELGKTRDTALKNAWIGNHANTKRRALELALVGAK